MIRVPCGGCGRIIKGDTLARLRPRMQEHMEACPEWKALAAKGGVTIDDVGRVAKPGPRVVVGRFESPVGAGVAGLDLTKKPDGDA